MAAQRTASYRVTLSYDKSKRSLELAPDSEEKFAPFAISSKHDLHDESGQYRLHGSAIIPTRVD